ncbi:fic family toxin-antitoxin system, toxin component [Streptomyces sp. NBC_01455]|uniref:fic family toxin-antitoxin system, toxin component n=1 Tax=Streptomyces sp. NBC_01455 TaxID=2903874 RepID=UPI002E3378C2|nr:fic family toxin-antitoxin system, toxin component [Streptomyces sp. NBC_01455]
MTHFLTTQHLLSLAGELPDDPACDDLSVLDSILARPRARYLGRDVCGSDWLKAAAMLETAARLRPLERHNDIYAWVIARVFLDMNGHHLGAPPDEALKLVAASRDERVSVPEIAARLRAWSAE